MHLAGLSIFAVYTTYFSREDKAHISAAGLRDFIVYLRKICSLKFKQAWLGLFQFIFKIGKPLWVGKIPCTNNSEAICTGFQSPSPYSLHESMVSVYAGQQ